jgi:uncharacterized delta-60 repeat protein
VCALAIVGSLLSAGSAFAAAGDLDTSFANGGKFVQNFRVKGATSDDALNDVVVRPDGSILAGGSTFVVNPPVSSDFEFVVLQLSASGAPGAPGGTTFSFGSPPTSGASALALQPDGALLLAGTNAGMGSDMYVDRLTATGAFDTSWGGLAGSGHPKIDFAGKDGAGVATDAANDLVRQPDGAVVAAGFSDNQFALARLGSSGILDNSFDFNGLKRIDFSGVIDSASSVALSGPKIIAAGETDNRLAIASLNADGTPDATFRPLTPGRTEGTTTTLPLGANDLAIQPDGKILVAGPAGGDFGVARVMTTGIYDPTFGSNGQVSFDFGGADVANAIALQPDGKVLVAGTDGDGFAVARLTPSGALDPSFGVGGKATVNFTGVDEARGMALQPDGAIVLVGSTTFGTAPPDFAIARLLGDPRPAVAPPAVGPGSTCDGKPATIGGSAGDDQLTGTAGDDVIAGLGGNDRLSGLGGKDTICGGDGNDKLKGGGGKDKLLGEAGKDTLRGGPAKDKLVGGPGKDKLVQ